MCVVFLKQPLRARLSLKEQNIWVKEFFLWDSTLAFVICLLLLGMLFKSEKEYKSSFFERIDQNIKIKFVNVLKIE